MCSSVDMLRYWLGVFEVEAFFYCQGMSKTRSVLDVQVPVELQQIYEGPLKGNMSLLNA